MGAVSGGLGALGALTSYTSNKQNNAMLEYSARQAEKSIEINRSNAEQAYAEKGREIGFALTEERRKSLRDSATIRAQMAGSGVAGVSSDRILSNIKLQSILNEGSIIASGQTEMLNIIDGITNANRQLRAQAVGQRAQKVDGVMMLLDVGGATLSGIGTGLSIDNSIKAGNAKFSKYGNGSELTTP